jgi:hypothetical protein
MSSVVRAVPKKQRLNRRQERGVLLAEMAVAIPVFFAVTVGVVKANRSVNANRVIERAIGEALLQHDLEGEIPVTGGGSLQFTFALGDDSQDSAQLSSCNRGNVRCRAAGDASLKLARVVRASFPQSMDTRLMRELSVTMTYADLPLGDPSDYTISNGLLTIRVDSGVTGGIESSASVSRTEAIG